MSYCKEEGKDKVIFLTKEDYEKPSTASLEEDEEEPGLILDNGDINWSCPCLGGMATGPCGVEFREAFSCFHYSEEEIKGADCYDQFKKMQDCMSDYPELYDGEKDDDEKSPFDEEDTETTEQIPESNESNDVTSDTSNTEKTVVS